MGALYGEPGVWWLKPWVWPTVVAGRQGQKQRSAAGSPPASAKAGLGLTSQEKRADRLSEDEQ